MASADDCYPDFRRLCPNTAAAADIEDFDAYQMVGSLAMRLAKTRSGWG